MLADILVKVASDQGKEEGQAPYRPRPSSAGPERCIRAMAYHANGTPRAPLPGRSILVFDDSSWHEELTADWIQKTAFRIHSRQMAVDTPCGRGHIDGVITDLLNVDRLWEHKAINHFSFNRYWEGTYPLDYFTQCALYVKGLQAVNPSIQEALLLIKNKNTAQYMEFLLRYDVAKDSLRIVEMVRSDGERKQPEFEYHGILEDAVAKFAAVELFRSAGDLPPRPFEFGTEFPCSYCLWNKTCWDGFAEEFNAMPDGAELGIAELVSRFQAVKGDEARAKEEKDAIREQILARLAALNVRGGRAGEFVVTAKVQKRAAFTVPESEFIQLNVRKSNGGKNGRGT